MRILGSGLLRRLTGPMYWQVRFFNSSCPIMAHVPWQIAFFRVVMTSAFDNDHQKVKIRFRKQFINCDLKYRFSRLNITNRKVVALTEGIFVLLLFTPC